MWVRPVRYSNFAPRRLSGFCPEGFASPDPLLAWTGTTNGRLRLPSCVTPSLITAAWWYRNINRLSIAYAYLPRLRSRLTLSGRAFLRKPRACGGQDSHLSFRYSYRHSLFHALHPTFRCGFAGHGTLPYHADSSASVASVSGLSPDHFRRRPTRPVSYYALFEWWLLLSQHPGCLSGSTSFAT